METQQGLPSTVMIIESHTEQQQLSVASAITASTWSSDRQAWICQAPQMGSDVLLQLPRQRQGFSSAMSATECNIQQLLLLLLLQLQLSVAPSSEVLLQLMRQRQALSDTISVTESNIQQVLPQLTVAHSLNVNTSNSSPFSQEMMLQGIGSPDLLQLLLLRIQSQQGLASAAPATISNSSSFRQEQILHGLSRDRGFVHNFRQHIHSQQGLSPTAVAPESAKHQQHQHQHQQHQDLASIVSSLNNVRNLMSSLRQSQSVPSIRGDRDDAPTASPTPPSLRSCGMTMGLPDDNRRLSEYQIVIRQHLEIFEAKQEDVRSNIQGRKRRLFLGQAGIRCRHCSNLRLRHRGRAAVYYPLKLSGLYQAAQHMARSHLSDICSQIHPGIKQRLRDLRLRRETASGGKEYWAEAGRAIGLYETEDGLRLHPGAAP
jgi:hypothetical protein